VLQRYYIRGYRVVTGFTSEVSKVGISQVDSHGVTGMLFKVLQGCYRDTSYGVVGCYRV
jgi:hypothetical protein